MSSLARPNLRLPSYLALVLLTGGVLLPGCAAKPSDSSAPPTVTTSIGAEPSAEPSAVPSPSSAPVSPNPEPLVITVDGAGAYRVGGKLSQLQGASLLADVSTGGEICTEHTSARGVGRWDSVQLWFLPDGTLDLVIVRDTKIATPSGAKVGMTLDQLKARYGTRGEELTNGGAKAYIVIVSSGRSLFFDFDLSNGKVISIIAGDGERLKSGFLAGRDC